MPNMVNIMQRSNMKNWLYVTGIWKHGIFNHDQEITDDQEIMDERVLNFCSRRPWIKIELMSLKGYLSSVPKFLSESWTMFYGDLWKLTQMNGLFLWMNQSSIYLRMLGSILSSDIKLWNSWFQPDSISAIAAWLTWTKFSLILLFLNIK